MKRSRWVALSLFLLCTSVGCASNPDKAAPAQAPAASELPRVVQGDPWREVRLFHQHGAWVGADSAYSVDLGARRVLWLFADTFVDPAADGLRENGPNFFLRNSVGIQTGPTDEIAYDMARAQMSFSWGPEQGGVPSSFFRDVDGMDEWVWPLHGARLPDGKLLIFRMRVVHVKQGLGFAVRAWDAVAVDEPDLAPSAWAPRLIAEPQNPHGVVLGSSVLLHDGHLYVYAVRNDSDDHSIFLARYALAALAGLSLGALDDPEWYCGARGFVRQREGATPVALFEDGQVELSVHYEPQLSRFVLFQMQGVLLGDAQTQLGVRYAERPEGPWTVLSSFHRPQEATREDARNLVAYAAKAHPEQRAGRGYATVLTYVVNDLTKAPGDALYYPKPLRVRFGHAP